MSITNMDENIQKEDGQVCEPVCEINIINRDDSAINSMSFIGPDQTSYSDIAYGVSPIATGNNEKANEWLQQVRKSTDSTDDERDEFIKNGTIHLRGLHDELNTSVNLNVKQYTDRLIDIGTVGLKLKELNKGSKTSWSKFSKKKISFLNKRVLQRAMRLAKRADCHEISCLGVGNLDQLCRYSDDIPKLLADHDIQYGENSQITMSDFRKAVKATIAHERLKKEGFDFPFEDVVSAVNCNLKVDKPLIGMLKAAQENSEDPLTVFQTISARMSPAKMKQLYYETISSLEQGENKMYQGLVEGPDQDEEAEGEDVDNEPEENNDTDSSTETGGGPSDQGDQENVEDQDLDPEENVDTDTEGDASGDDNKDSEEQDLDLDGSEEDEDDLDINDTTDTETSDDDLEENDSDTGDDETDEDDIEPEDVDTNEDTDPEIETEEPEDEIDDNNPDISNLDEINDVDILKLFVVHLRKNNQDQKDELEIKNGFIAELKQDIEGLEEKVLDLEEQLEGRANLKTSVSADLKIDPMDEVLTNSMA